MWRITSKKKPSGYYLTLDEPAYCPRNSFHGSKELDVIIVYRSEQGSTLQLIQSLGDLIIPGKAIIICGDFNICYRETRNNRVTKFLNQLGFSQLMKEPTHIRGRTIDLIYFRDGSVIHENPIIHRYSPYYSDHDAICATIKRSPDDSSQQDTCNMTGI